MKLTEKILALLAAAAFAEENEHRTAIEIAREVTAAQGEPAPRTLGGTFPGNLAVNHGK